MEYKRAYRDERPDENLVSRHEREIFPLLRKRQLFSEVDNFLLYDLFAGNGTVNEDVFAYSNRLGEERSLIVFNNRYSRASGWIRSSVGFRGENGRIIQKSLQDGLSLKGSKNDFLIFEDIICHLEYLRPVKALKREGLYVELGAYKYNVFMNFREVQASAENPYDELCAMLNGNGVPCVEGALQDYRLRDVHASFYAAMNAGSLRYLLGITGGGGTKSEREGVFLEKASRLVSTVSLYSHIGKKVDHKSDEMRSEFSSLVGLPGVLARSRKLRLELPSGEDSLPGWRVLFLWLFIDPVRALFNDDKGRSEPFEDLRLTSQVVSCFRDLGVGEDVSTYESKLAAEILESVHRGIELDLPAIVIEAMSRQSGRNLLSVNNYDGVEWFNKERFEDFLRYLTLAAIVKKMSQIPGKASQSDNVVVQDVLEVSSKIQMLAGKANYRVHDLVAELLTMRRAMTLSEENR